MLIPSYRRSLIAILLAAAAFVPCALAQQEFPPPQGNSRVVTKNEIEKAINKSDLKHPYLYFSEADKPALLKRIKNDPVLRDMMNRMLAAGKMLLSMPVDYYVPFQGRNTRGDWTEYDRDGKYEAHYSLNRTNAFNLAFLYQMTGEQKYADKAFQFADVFCDLPTWTQRPHEFPIIYSRIMPWNVPDDMPSFSVDHYCGDSGRLMAAVYDWLYPALTVAQRDRIRGALLEKVVTRVRGNYEYHWWATAYRCNWCGVCNSGVGLAGLALLLEDPQLTDIIAESYNRINSLFNQLDIDGGWQEGAGYWNYGISTSVFFADALKRATKGQYNLFENERLKSNPVSFPVFISLPGGGVFPFEDSGGGRPCEKTLVNKLTAETQNGLAAWYLSEFFGERSSRETAAREGSPRAVAPRAVTQRGAGDIFDIIWPNQSAVEPVPPVNPSLHFRTIDWWAMRSDFKDENKVVVGGKAGKNDDPHHGHLDIGHMVVWWRGDFFLTDIGRGTYDEKYFDDARWDYPEASSLGHNVVFVNGEKQLPGKMRRQPWNHDIGGKVLKFNTAQTVDYVLMDPTNAYPGVEMKGWRRHVILDKPVITIIVDEVKCAPGSEIEVRFHPGVQADNKGTHVLLTGAKGALALIPVVNQEFIIRSGRHASQVINPTAPFEWKDYFGTVVNAVKNNTVIATVILPVDNDSEAQQICRSINKTMDGSGNYTLSLAKGNKEVKYVFGNTKEGLNFENTESGK